MYYTHIILVANVNGPNSMKPARKTPNRDTEESLATDTTSHTTKQSVRGNFPFGCQNVFALQWCVCVCVTWYAWVLVCVCVCVSTVRMVDRNLSAVYPKRTGQGWKICSSLYCVCVCVCCAYISHMEAHHPTSSFTYTTAITVYAFTIHAQHFQIHYTHLDVRPSAANSTR